MQQRSRLGIALILSAWASVAMVRAQETVLLRVGEGGSPHVLSDWRLGDTHIAVEYGRPYAKGRHIFGGLLRYGDIWRIGADEATILKTSAALNVGGVAVPAGAYTLWTILDEKHWTLIVNKQTGQWGTSYDAKQDLARVDMRVEPASELIEQVTISIDPQPRGGLLSIAWEHTRASVPLVFDQQH